MFVLGGENMKSKKGLSGFVSCLILFLIAILFILLIFVVIPHLTGSLTKEKITLNEMTQEKHEMAMQAMFDLKPEYAQRINELSFSANLSWIKEKCKPDLTPEERAESRTEGCYVSPSNRIYVFVPDSESRLREILCHELLHDIIDLEPKEEHLLVYELGHRLVCYKDFSDRIDLNLEGNLTLEDPIKFEKSPNFWELNSLGVNGSLVNMSPDAVLSIVP